LAVSGNPVPSIHENNVIPRLTSPDLDLLSSADNESCIQISSIPSCVSKVASHLKTLQQKVLACDCSLPSSNKTKQKEDFNSQKLMFVDEMTNVVASPNNKLTQLVVEGVSTGYHMEQNPRNQKASGYINIQRLFMFFLSQKYYISKKT